MVDCLVLLRFLLTHRVVLQLSPWERETDGMGSFQSPAVPAAEAPISHQTPAEPSQTRNRIQQLRSKVYAMSAIKAFSGFVQSINKVTQTSALSGVAAVDGGGDGAAGRAAHPDQLTGEEMLRRASDLLLEQRRGEEVGAALAELENAGLCLRDAEASALG